MRIHRAHDGKTIEVKQSVSQFNSIDELIDSISLATAIASDDIICMSSDGLQLNDELFATLTTAASSSSSSDLIEFFVFNRDYLYADIDVVAGELAEQPSLAAPLSPVQLVQPPTPRSLESITQWSHGTLENIQAHVSTSRDHHAALSTMQRSISVALLNLVSHSGTVTSDSLAIRTDCDRDLDRMSNLLHGYQQELEILSLVQVDSRIASNSEAHATSSSKRTLGDFVSRAKMGTVAEACNKVYLELKSTLDNLKSNARQLETDTADLRHEVEGSNIDPSQKTLNDALRCEANARDTAVFLIESCSPDTNGWPVADKLDGLTLDQIQQNIDELQALDTTARVSVERLTADRNDMTARSLALLGDISSLQSDYADLAAGMSAFNDELHSKRVDGFRHLARLSNMLWAYGATMVEAVRRREFSAHFLAKSQALAELMARVSARERRRRGKYRTDVAGQLPWTVKGMDEVPPSLEISTTQSNGTAPDVQRKDVVALLQVIEKIEATFVEADQINGDATSGNRLAEVKDALQQLVSRLDEADEEFAVMVEEHVLGVGDSDDENDDDEPKDENDDSPASSSGALSRKRTRRRATLESSNTALLSERKEKERLQQEVQQLIRQADEREKTDLDQHQSELNNLRSESSAARREAQRLRDELERYKHDHTSAQSELQSLRGDVETERERRMNMQDELSSLRQEAQAAHRAEEQAKQEAAEEVERVAELEAHLHDVQSELEESKAARADATHRIESLLNQGSSVDNELRAAQNRIESLVEQLAGARAEAREAREAHAEVDAARERAMRSHRAEADGDRAILEETLRERETEMQSLQQETQAAKETARIEYEAAETLRCQLRGADDAHEELVKSMEAAKDASAEADFAKRHAERQREVLHDLVRPLLENMLMLRRHLLSLPALSSSRNPSSTIAATPSAGDAKQLDEEPSLQTNADSTDEDALRQMALEAFSASSADHADVDVTLAALRAFSPRQSAEEIVAKLDLLVTLVRKWQKTYKRHTGEAATKIAATTRDRIAFRNFQVGDLALFLPSRNNALDPKPWAAFNVSFPHFFLNAPFGSVLAEQLRSKEWIVARIVRIVENVTDSKAPGGNPFQLAEGVKFSVLDVEGWSPTPVPGSAARPSKSRHVSAVHRRDSRSNSIDQVASPPAAVESTQIQSPFEAPTDSASKGVPGADQEGTPDKPSAFPEATTTSTAHPPSNLSKEDPIPPVPAVASAPASPSALTRALRAAGRSQSPSDPRKPTEGPSGVVATGSKTNSQVLNSTDGLGVPAFGGVRTRRKGLRGSHNGGEHSIQSAATSPGMTSAYRAGNFNMEAAAAAAAMSNPFSSSPGPGVASLPTIVAPQDQNQSPLATWADRKRAKSRSRGASVSAKEESLASPKSRPLATPNAPFHRTSSVISIHAGSLTLNPGSAGSSSSPANGAAPSGAMPIRPEASFALARGETSGPPVGSFGGSLEDRSSAASGSGISNQAGSRAANPPQGESGRPAVSPSASSMPRSPSFLSRTLAKRMSSYKQGGGKGFFGGGTEESADDGGAQAASSSSPASASQMLRRLTEQR